MPIFSPTDLLIGEAQAILKLNLEGDVDYDSEVVLVVLAASIGATQAYAIQRDGWVGGLISNIGSAWACTVNVEPSSTQPGASAGIFTGEIWYGLSGTVADRIAAQSPMRIPIKKNDILRFRNYAASATGIMVILSYPKAT